MVGAIVDMRLRGAGCIGAAAGYGMYLAALTGTGHGGSSSGASMERSAAALLASRPTAVNLRWAVERQLRAVAGLTGDERVERARVEAEQIAAEDVDHCRRIGEHGLELVGDVHRRTGQAVNILTHCNAGWLAFVDHGSVTAA